MRLVANKTYFVSISQIVLVFHAVVQIVRRKSSLLSCESYAHSKYQQWHYHIWFGAVQIPSCPAERHLPCSKRTVCGTDSSTVFIATTMVDMNVFSSVLQYENWELEFPPAFIFQAYKIFLSCISRFNYYTLPSGIR